MKRAARHARDPDYLARLHRTIKTCCLCGLWVRDSEKEAHHVDTPRAAWKVNTKSYEDPIHIDYRAVITHRECHRRFHSEREVQALGPEKVRQTLEMMGEPVQERLREAGWIGEQTR